MFRGKWKTYFHTLTGLALGMIVIMFTLNFLRQKGPAIVQGPADTLGQLISGSRYNF